MKFKYLVLRALAAIIDLHLGRGEKRNYEHHALIANQCNREADRLQEIANGEILAINTEYGRKK